MAFMLMKNTIDFMFTKNTLLTRLYGQLSCRIIILFTMFIYTFLIVSPIWGTLIAKYILTGLFHTSSYLAWKYFKTSKIVTLTPKFYNWVSRLKMSSHLEFIQDFIGRNSTLDVYPQRSNIHQATSRSDISQGSPTQQSISTWHSYGKAI